MQTISLSNDSYSTLLKLCVLNIFMVSIVVRSPGLRRVRSMQGPLGDQCSALNRVTLEGRKVGIIFS